MYLPFFIVALAQFCIGLAMIHTMGTRKVEHHNGPDIWGMNLMLSGGGGLVTGAVTWLIMWVMS